MCPQTPLLYKFLCTCTYGFVCLLFHKYSFHPPLGSISKWRPDMVILNLLMGYKNKQTNNKVNKTHTKKIHWWRCDLAVTWLKNTKKKSNWIKKTLFLKNTWSGDWHFESVCLFICLFVCVYVGILVFCTMTINYWTLVVGLSRRKTLTYTHLSLCWKEETKIWKSSPVVTRNKRIVLKIISEKHIVMKMDLMKAWLIWKNTKKKSN